MTTCQHTYNSALFPKECGYTVDELVQLWITQGFIQPLRSKTLEQTGKIYFHELLSRYFFQKTYFGGERCVILDLLHDLAEYLFDGELLRVEDYLLEKNLAKRVLHAYIHA